MSNYCKKHPSQKLTELFTSSVCDVCDPPKGSLPLDSYPQLNHPPAVGYCLSKCATANKLCMLPAGHYLNPTHVYAPPCTAHGCKLFDGHSGVHTTQTRAFLGALKHAYPDLVASRIEVMTELVDAGVLTIPECQSLMDWEVDLSSVGPGWNGKVTL